MYSSANQDGRSWLETMARRRCIQGITSSESPGMSPHPPRRGPHKPIQTPPLGSKQAVLATYHHSPCRLTAFSTLQCPSMSAPLRQETHHPGDANASTHATSAYTWGPPNWSNGTLVFSCSTAAAGPGIPTADNSRLHTVCWCGQHPHYPVCDCGASHRLLPGRFQWKPPSLSRILTVGTEDWPRTSFPPLPQSHCSGPWVVKICYNSFNGALKLLITILIASP
jgi:hypothetical protein